MLTSPRLSARRAAAGSGAAAHPPAIASDAPDIFRSHSVSLNIFGGGVAVGGGGTLRCPWVLSVASNNAAVLRLSTFHFSFLQHFYSVYFCNDLQTLRTAQQLITALGPVFTSPSTGCKNLGILMMSLKKKIFTVHIYLHTYIYMCLS